MLTNTHTITIEKDPDGIYIGEISDMPACYTQAPTLPLLLERMIEVSEGSMR